jgi:hypothetical protein
MATSMGCCGKVSVLVVMVPPLVETRRAFPDAVMDSVMPFSPPSIMFCNCAIRGLPLLVLVAAEKGKIRGWVCPAPTGVEVTGFV